MYRSRFVGTVGVVAFIIVIFGSSFARAESVSIDASSKLNATSTESKVTTTTTTTSSSGDQEKNSAALAVKKADLDKRKASAEASLAQKKADMASAKAERAADATKNCDKIETHIASVTSKYDTNKTRNIIAYKNMRTRFSTLITRFTAKGLDTTTLTADLATLDLKLVQLDTDYAAYITALLDTKQFVCGKSEGQFKAALGGARTQMLTVKADITDIQTFYQTSLKTDLTALKTQIEATEKAATSSTTSGTTTTTPTTTTSSTTVTH